MARKDTELIALLRAGVAVVEAERDEARRKLSCDYDTGEGQNCGKCKDCLEVNAHLLEKKLECVCKDAEGAWGIVKARTKHHLAVEAEKERLLAILRRASISPENIRPATGCEGCDAIPSWPRYQTNEYRWRHRAPSGIQDDTWCSRIDLEGSHEMYSGRHEMHSGRLIGDPPRSEKQEIVRPVSAPCDGEVEAYDAGWNAHEVGLARESVRLLSRPSGQGWALLAYDTRELITARVETEDGSREGEGQI